MKIQCSESLKELDIKLLWLGFLGDSKKWQKVCRKNVLKSGNILTLKKNNISNQLGNPALTRLLKVTPTVYPHLNDFYRETKCSLKWTHSTKNLKTKYL